MTIFFAALCLILGSILSILLSASETSITMASRFRLQQMAKKGHKKASLLLSLQDQLNIMIGTILLGNTCLFAGMTTLVTKIVSQHFGNVGLVVSSLLMGTFMTIYLEVVPKIYAAQAPEKVGLALAVPISRVKTLLKPVTSMMDFVAHKTLAMFGVDGPPVRNPLEELHGAIDLYIGDNTILQERAMLRSVLDLSQVHVDEFMIPRQKMLSLCLEEPSQDFLRKILAFPYSHVPLWKDSPENIVGLINLKDLARHLQKEEELFIDKLIQKPHFVPKTNTLFAQLQFFKVSHLQQAFVIDEYGSLLGLITLEDILYEIIKDAQEEEIAIEISKLEYEVEGHTPLKVLKRLYNWPLKPVEGVSTLSELILHKTHTVVEEGTCLFIQNMKVMILEVQGQDIKRVRLIPQTLNGENLIIVPHANKQNSTLQDEG